MGQLQEELVSVQSSLFSLGLELEVSQRSLRQSQRREADLLRFKDRLNSDLQEALQHREVTEKHNQVSRKHCLLLELSNSINLMRAFGNRTFTALYKKPALSFKRKKLL